jgi:hypothetical protein
MNKRSATMIAVGLAAALLAGVAAVRMTAGGAIPTSAASERAKPIVRTIDRTITVHRKAKAAPQPAVVMLPAAGSASSSLATSSFGDDSMEFEGFDGGSGEDD